MWPLWPQQHLGNAACAHLGGGSGQGGFVCVFVWFCVLFLVLCFFFSFVSHHPTLFSLTISSTIFSQVESVLRMTVINTECPCFYLDPQAFSSYFLPLCCWRGVRGQPANINPPCFSIFHANQLLAVKTGCSGGWKVEGAQLAPGFPSPKLQNQELFLKK